MGSVSKGIPISQIYYKLQINTPKNLGDVFPKNGRLFVDLYWVANKNFSPSAC